MNAHNDSLYLSCEKGHAGPVDPSIVGSCGHALEVVLALTRGDVGTGQLTIVDMDLVS